MASPQRNRSANCCEVLIGQSLAACVHPIAAWRSTARSFKVMLFAGYFTAAYVGVLTALVLL
jgi:hypothetical protein